VCCPGLPGCWSQGVPRKRHWPFEKGFKSIEVARQLALTHKHAQTSRHSAWVDSGIPHLRAVSAEAAGFHRRQGKHIVMTDGIRLSSVPGMIPGRSHDGRHCGGCRSESP
jgi:hypothetical protein